METGMVAAELKCKVDISGAWKWCHPQLLPSYLGHAFLDHLRAFFCGHLQGTTTKNRLRQNAVEFLRSKQMRLPILLPFRLRKLFYSVARVSRASDRSKLVTPYFLR